MPPLLNLSAAVGEGFDNLENDVAAVNDALSAIGDRNDEDPDVGHDTVKSLLTPSLSRSIEKHQEANNLRVDGHLNPGGPTEQSINNRLLRKPAGAGLLGRRPLRLAGGVGNDRENREDDVVAVKKALGGLGLMAEDPFDRPHPFIDLPTTGGIRAFQRAKKLKEDGALEPGGETESALRIAVADLARSFGPEWRAFQKRKAAAEGKLKSDDAEAPNATFQQAMMLPPVAIGTVGPRVMVPRVTRPRIPMPLPQPPAPPPSGHAMPDDASRAAGDALRKLFQSRRKADDRPNTAHGQPKQNPGPLTGPDPDKARRRPGNTGHTSPPPKKPNKTVLPQREPPGLKDAIEIFPDHSDLNKMPIWVEVNPHGRKGSPTVREQTRRAGQRGRAAFGKSFTSISKGEFEGHVKNRDTRGDKPRTTKGDSYADYVFVAEHPRGDIRVVIDTYTALRNRNPDARERRQFEKLYYNEGDRTLYVRLPKPPKGREIYWKRYDRYMEALGKRIKSGLDSGKLDLSNRTNTERFFKSFKP